MSMPPVGGQPPIGGQPPMGGPPPGGQVPPGGNPSYGMSGGGAPQEASQSTMALILSIAGLAVGIILCCCFVGPFIGLPLSIAGFIFAKKESEGIAAGLRDPLGAGKANAAKIVGIIGMVINTLLVLYLLWALIFGDGASFDFEEFQQELESQQ